MKKKYNMLQIGGENYQYLFSEYDEVQWVFQPFTSLADIDEIKEKLKRYKAFDFVFVQASYSEALIQVFRLVSSPYNTYVDQQYWNAAFKAEDIVREKMIRPFSYESNTERIEKLLSLAFSGQYGDHISPSTAIVSHSFKGEYYHKGKHTLVMTGDFGDDFQPILSWKMYLYNDKNKVNQFWAEYTTTDNVEISYTLRLYEGANMEGLKSTYVLEGDLLKRPFNIPLKNYDAYILVTAKAKGKGQLTIGNIHKRWTRLEFGEFILGGQRFSDDVREELIYYFDPGDLKPPLNVYFSGYRTAEGFEGFYMMRKLGAPFLLFADPRLEGGGFYLGNDLYENQIKKIIQEMLQWLGFQENDLILSGLSMGSFAALYYGVQLNTTAIIVGKPLVNVGKIAGNMRLIRPEDFGTALDVLLKNENAIDANAINRLDNKFWHTLNHSDFSDTIFAISYMENDDYDLDAFHDLLPVLSRHHARVMSRSIPGRHNDDTDAITNWFANFYHMILESRFGRVRHESKQSI
ncbi:TPA: accessory Sec system protein Asp2 [Staphylococcus delphini]|nr:accessory Sec system protein Asp2 [Staphylococcus delphini]HEC2150685.1 accessory Sec system protein Asp2 [Staphylococcus delphini]HEC2161057.1 accessory Sec system protein Asp2 [Staphylococcus delphini]HEC2169151.1 accessory Sec system protein Asp2 [Staphylococcus delphini]HEC2171507.1 accessory Sec system protein Asp2 [Staphylococcus delphini]